MTTAAADLEILIQQLEHIVANPDVALESGPRRHEIRRLARQAAVALDNQFETLQRVVYSPMVLVTVRISQRKHIYRLLENNKNGDVSFATLRDESGLDPQVLGAVMEILCAQGMARETGPGKYAPTRVTKFMQSTLYENSISFFHDVHFPASTELYNTLAEPASKETAFMRGHRTDCGFYEWMRQRPELQRCFHKFLEEQFSGLPSWLDGIDSETIFGKNIDENDVAFVDVGGGHGQVCDLVRRKLPNLRGRMILQDKSDILAEALSVEGVEKLPYNYFEDQPVHGARVYYFRQILHNNNDENCLQILKSQVPALGPESIIVVDEKVLPDDRKSGLGDEYKASLSLTMKMFFDSEERCESKWRDLFKQSGLVVKSIRKYSDYDDCVIIAGLA